MHFLAASSVFLASFTGYLQKGKESQPRMREPLPKTTYTYLLAARGWYSCSCLTAAAVLYTDRATIYYYRVVVHDRDDHAVYSVGELIVVTPGPLSGWFWCCRAAAAESALLCEEPKCACSKMGTTWSEKISAWRPVVMYFTTYLVYAMGSLI